MRELFVCCRTGNLSRIRNLYEEKDVDLNMRDKWDGTPLYYACLCGHYDVVAYLLQNGAQCDANTFDGERCLYGALTDNIRNLLKNFKVITADTLRRDKYSEFLRRIVEQSDHCDIQFVIGDEKILAHRVILAARSKYFQHLFSDTWKNKVLINLNHFNVESGNFRSILQYLYIGQVNINKKELGAFISLAKHFSLTCLVTEMENILALKKNTAVFCVQPRPLPQQDFLKLFVSSLPKELRPQVEFKELLYIDLHITVGSCVFFCHKVFICGRCSYLKALVSDHFSETSIYGDNGIQVITIHDITPKIFVNILEYIYTNTTDLTPENVSDVLYYADMFILPGLKKLCSSVLQENLATDNIISLLKLARLYDLPRLETQCAKFMAENLEEILDQPDFKNLILEDAKEIKNREETDTISIIDDIRYHIDNSTQVSDTLEKHFLIGKLLENLRLEA